MPEPFHDLTHSFTNVPPRYRLGQRAHRGFRSYTVSHKAPVWAHSCTFCTQLTYRKSTDKLVLQPICTRMTFSLTCMSSHRSRYRQFESMMTALDQLNDWMKVNRLRLNQGKTQFMWIGRGQMLDKIDRDGIHERFPDVEFLTSVNDFGVVLNENLDMDEQIGNTCRSATTICVKSEASAIP